MKKISKKTLITAMSVMLVLALVITGTVAYLQAVSEKKTNEFQKNKVTVELEETTEGYDIVPGTTEDKDPTVSGTATLPAYVFVEVEDQTAGLVDYTIDSGWAPVPGYDNVYYREVDGSGDYGPFPVLEGNQVSYSEDITNEMMDAAEDDVLLSFTAYAIQKAPFNDPATAWEALQNSTEPAVELPNATMTEIEPPAEVTDQDESWTGSLDMAVNFSTSDTEESIADKEYKDWIVDFALSFNKDIEDGSVVHLFGNYGDYGWLGDDLAAGGTATLAANNELMVMADWFLPAVGMGDGQITYNDVVTLIQSFDCGVAVTDETLADGLVATLKLIMTDGEGTVHVVDTKTFSF